MDTGRAHSHNSRTRRWFNIAKIPLRSKTVEHPFGTIKAWMGATHFRMKTLKHVATEMALHVLAYNMMRVMAIIGVPKLVEALKA